MDILSPLLCLVGGFVVFAILLIATAIRIIPEYRRLVVFRLGRYIGAKGPGLIFLIPFMADFILDAAPEEEQQGVQA